MLGAIIGDIVGSRFEFDNTKSADFRMFTDYCSFTDDTICTVAVADAILNEKSYQDSLLEWCRRYPYPKGGYGTSFARWIHEENPLPYNSYGNGSAMRVSPIGWLFDDEKEVLQEALKSASVTHSHPEGIKGAQVVAHGILMLRKGSSKEQVLRYVERQYGKIPAYRPFSNPFDETCMNAVPVSFSCFLASTDFEDAIRKAILVGGDSDTIGAITGSLTEAKFGIPDAIQKAAMTYLPDRMINILNQFTEIIK